MGTDKVEIGPHFRLSFDRDDGKDVFNANKRGLFNGVTRVWSMVLSKKDCKDEEASKDRLTL
jgi:hypothetical protein